MVGSGIKLSGDCEKIEIKKNGDVYTCDAPKGIVKNSVGAGDSMVAGFIAAFLETGDFEKAVEMRKLAIEICKTDWKITEGELIDSEIREIERIKEKMTKCEQAAKVGELIAKKAQEAGVTTVVFDRNGFLYHGRVKQLADAARNAGLKF